MGSKDRPHREATKKPKSQAGKQPKLESLLEAPPPSVEVIKPKRKPRHEREPEPEEE